MTTKSSIKSIDLDLLCEMVDILDNTKTDFPVNALTLDDNLNAFDHGAILDMDTNPNDLSEKCNIDVLSILDSTSYNIHSLKEVHIKELRGQNIKHIPGIRYIKETTIAGHVKKHTTRPPIEFIYSFNERSKNDNKISLAVARLKGNSANFLIDKEIARVGQDRIPGVSAFMCMQFYKRYQWIVNFKNPGAKNGLEIEADPSGIKDIFKDRDKPHGYERKPHLKRWITEHFRKKRNSESDGLFIRKHLRGHTSFNWFGYDVTIKPSQYDLEKNNDTR